MKVEYIKIIFAGYQEIITLGDDVSIGSGNLDVYMDNTSKEFKLHTINPSSIEIIETNSQRSLTIDDIDDRANEVMDLIREITGMDSDSDEDDQMYSTVHNIMTTVYDECEMVNYFEEIEDGVQLITTLHSRRGTDLSKEEFVQDLHFDSQVPYHLIRAAVKNYVNC